MAITTISIIGSAEIDLSNLKKGKANALFQLLREQGFVLTTQPSGDFLLAIDHNRKMYNAFINRGNRLDHTILLRLEPESVFPAQYKKSVMIKYGRVISPGMLPTQSSSNLEFGWPYQYHLDPNYPTTSDPSLAEVLDNPTRRKIINIESWAKRPILLSMIAANKVSPISSENYSTRRKIASKIPNNVLEVYGPLWNDNLRTKMHHRLAVSLFSLRQGTVPNLKSVYGNLFKRYSNTKGAVEDKHAVLQRSKFSLVIENSNLCVTEKLFDSLVSGVIPIYVGPDLNRLGFPQNLALASSGDAAEILKFLDSTDINIATSMLQAGQNFLMSLKFKENWTEEAVYKKICAEIGLQFDSKDIV